MAVIDENTVSSKGQLKPDQYVSYLYPEHTGLRILFVGNSITRHGIAPAIGWHWDWGMAASREELDYVHQTASKVLSVCPDACFSIVQVAEWERSYKDDEKVLHLFETARQFAPDIIVMRLIENATVLPEDWQVFQDAYGRLIRFLDGGSKAKVLITTGFWHHKGDGALRLFAEKNGYPLVELGDLGDTDEMKALGLFEHHGVSIHPGDLGMTAIADRIFDGISDWLK